METPEQADDGARLAAIEAAIADIRELLPQLHEALRTQNQSYMAQTEAIRQLLKTTRAAIKLAVGSAGLERAPRNAIDLGRCARCGQALDNVAPGFSVVAGGLTVCANCLRPGEEIARARAIERGA